VRGNVDNSAARNVRSPSEPGTLVPKLPMQDGKLVTQGEDLGVLLVVGHRQQPQRREGVGDSEVGEADQHK
jgi:hypothetical protein